MRKIFVVCLIVVVFSGCARPLLTSPAPTPHNSILYGNVSAPLFVTDNSGLVMKKGSATSKSILGLVTTGDSSIRAAARDGGITKIHYVDHSFKHVFGIWSVYTVNVYGTAPEGFRSLPGEVKEASGDGNTFLTVLAIGGAVLIFYVAVSQ